MEHSEAQNAEIKQQLNAQDKEKEKNGNILNKRILHLDEKIERIERHLGMNQSQVQKPFHIRVQENPLQCSSRDTCHSDDIPIRGTLAIVMTYLFVI